MEIDLLFAARDIDARYTGGRICVVIDTLRAATSAIAGLVAGAREIVPAVSVEEALCLKQEAHFSDYLLGGELNNLKPAAFDLGNSPSEYTQATVKDKGIIMATNNCTVAVRRAQESSAALLIAALVNSRQTARFLAGAGADILFCCAGTRGHLAPEDFYTAGKIISCMPLDKTVLSGRAEAAAHFYNAYGQRGAPAVQTLFRSTANGSRLAGLGLEEDIAFCLQEDRYPVVVRLGDRGLSLSPF